MTGIAVPDGAAARPLLLARFGDIAGDYDGVLCDIWGVVHNGVRATPEACDALVRFRRNGGRVVLITNAPRPGRSVVPMLDALGVSREAYDGILSSGDLTRDILVRHAARLVFHLGPDRDRAIFDGLDVALVGPDQADILVNTGLFDDEVETPEDYAGLLAELAARDIEMICANPDIVVERGDRLLYCAGALGEAYSRIGGRVTWAGKPHPPIYESSIAMLETAAGRPVDRRRILAIGDSLRTDLAGAAAMGLDALFIASGIHAGEYGGGEAPDMDRLGACLRAAGLAPRAVMSRLAW